MSDYDNNHILFEIRPVENRSKSIDAGHPVYDNEEWITITPPGGNLKVERAITDADRENYARRYALWQQDREEPIEGTDIRLWPGASPALAQTLKAIDVHTVEALAAANDSILDRIGMGARALKAKASAWIDGANDIGRLAEQIAALTARNDDLQARSDELQAAVDQMKAEKATEKRGPGRPRKAA